MGRSSITVEAEADKANDYVEESKSAIALNNRRDRTISLSDNEGDEDRDEAIVDKSRQGEFAFDPMGPENLNDLESEPQILYQEVEANQVEDQQQMEETKQAVEMVPPSSASVPNATLQLLADENVSMKEDMEMKLNQIMEYKYII